MTGKNVIIDENDYNVGDVINLKVPDHEINESFRIKKKVLVYLLLVVNTLVS